MRGIIEKIWENESKKGQPYLTLLIDGERYSLWDKKHFADLEEGDEVIYQWKQSGDFRNISAIQRVETDGFSATQKRITRMGCLKYASSIVSLSDVDLKEKADYTIAMARDFERYVLEPGLDAEE